MSGLSRVAGIGPRVTLNGKDYQVRGKTNRFFAEVQAAIVGSRGDPFQMIVEAARRGKMDDDPQLLERVAEIVCEKFRNWKTATYRDYLEFLGSPEGDALVAHHCLKQDAPEVTLDETREYVVTMKFKGMGDDAGSQAAKKEVEALFKAIEIASGEGPPGNSNGQTQKLVSVGT